MQLLRYVFNFLLHIEKNQCQIQLIWCYMLNSFARWKFDFKQKLRKYTNVWTPQNKMQILPCQFEKKINKASFGNPWTMEFTKYWFKGLLVHELSNSWTMRSTVRVQSELELFLSELKSELNEVELLHLSSTVQSWVKSTS